MSPPKLGQALPFGRAQLLPYFLTGSRETSSAWLVGMVALAIALFAASAIANAGQVLAYGFKFQNARASLALQRLSARRL